MKFTVWRNQEDRWGSKRDLPWPEVAARLATHHVGTKDGTAFSPALFEGHRSGENLRWRTGIALDIESNPDTGEVPREPAVVADLLRTKGIASVVYTSFNHKPELPRYRIVAPLSEPINLLTIEKGVDRLVAANFAYAVWKELSGVTDRTKWGSSSIFFLGRHPEGAQPFARVVPGDPLPSDQLLAAAILGNDRRAMAAAQKKALAAASTYSEEDRAAIDNFNAEHDVEDLLARYGYRRGGGHGRWRSPNQHAGSQPAVVVFRNEQRWLSHSQSDQAEGIGFFSEDSGVCYGDSFSLFIHYECGGNFRVALERIRANTKPDAA